jgi:hypothetical protein
VRPLNTLFDPSRVTAVACDVAPTVTEAGDSVTDTVATAAIGAFTVRSAVPVLVSEVAVIVVVPAASVVTRPPLFTVATTVFELLHVMGRPLNTLFHSSR